MSSTAVATAPSATAQQSMLMLVASRLKEYGAETFKQRKPWSEVVDRNSFSKPASFSEATSRLRKNAAYFKINYLIVILATVAGSFLLHPTSLFYLSAVFCAWIYAYFVRQGPLTIGGRSLSDREKMLALSALSFITIFFLTDISTVLFSALSISSCLIAAHGASRVPDDLFLDEGQESQGLLSILGMGGAVPSSTSANV